MTTRPAIMVENGHRLRRRVSVRGIGTDVDTSAVARAEQALEELSSNFDQWVDDEVARLTAAREAARRNGCSGAFAEELFRAAHDLKGHAQTFRYPLIMRIGASLCRLLEATADDAETPDQLIDIHVEAARAIARDRLQGDGNPTAIAVVDQLATATDSFIAARSG